MAACRPRMPPSCAHASASGTTRWPKATRLFRAGDRARHRCPARCGRVESGMSMLDVSTGSGALAAEATRRGATVIGVDIASAMIAEARKNHPGRGRAVERRNRGVGVDLVLDHFPGYPDAESDPRRLG